ncbi:M-phase inducer phosphatase [Aethina tumida]|uniref:M-phase inducer phosphatase n=1 Tax=Aethina tumida TaxID=116153 RepID=UPI00214836B8|nr:M-phase inducer phosphatase [Aethina tumida]
MSLFKFDEQTLDAFPSHERRNSSTVTSENSGFISLDQIMPIDVNAVEYSASFDLVGDFTKPFSLPLVDGTQSDIRYISGSTLKGLIDGKYKNMISKFTIVDCRYPYEYEAGHIEGAINLYKQEQCVELFVDVAASEQPRNARNILVFHCEFSIERGPTMYKYVRQKDRALNADMYPLLCYPEIYVLKTGYSKYFEEYPDTCVPRGYKTMLDNKNRMDSRYKSERRSLAGKMTSKHRRRLQPQQKQMLRRILF